MFVILWLRMRLKVKAAAQVRQQGQIRSASMQNSCLNKLIIMDITSIKKGGILRKRKA